VTRIVAVCTGNVCRSPAVEFLLPARLPGAGLVVSSMGTRAMVGAAVDPPMADRIRSAGAEPAPFSARALQPSELRSADLVVVLAREHRAAVVALEPAAVRRTFLLRELAAIAGAVAAAGWPADVPADPAARLAVLPRLAAPHRSAAGADLDVLDPFRRDAQTYDAAMAQVTGAVDELARALG